jgi:hypothetical protein
VLALTRGRAGTPLFTGGSIAAIDVLFSEHLKRLDLIFIYLYRLMIFIGNLRLLKYPSVVDKWCSVRLGVGTKHILVKMSDRR